MSEQASNKETSIDNSEEKLKVLKLEYLSKLNDLSCEGITLSRSYDFNSNLDDMKLEYMRHNMKQQYKLFGTETDEIKKRQYIQFINEYCNINGSQSPETKDRTVVELERMCKIIQESTIRRSYEREQQLIELHTKYPSVRRVNSFDRPNYYSHYPQTQGIKLLGDLAMLFGSAMGNKIKENKAEPPMSSSSSSSSTTVPVAQTSTSTGSSDPVIASQIDTSIKMYFVVNNSLKMGKGKVAGQVGHGSAGITRRLERKINISFAQAEIYRKWVEESHEAKIILTASEEILDELRAKYHTITHVVHDAGKTQIAAGSFTVLAFIPLLPEQVPKELQSLKLLS